MLLYAVGGYFTVDPRTWLDEVNGDTNVVQILAEPEQYSGQTDWAADSETYTRRVKQPFISHSLSLNGDIGVNFYIGITAEQAENAGSAGWYPPDPLPAVPVSPTA